MGHGDGLVGIRVDSGPRGPGFISCSLPVVRVSALIKRMEEKQLWLCQALKCLKKRIDAPIKNLTNQILCNFRMAEQGSLHLYKSKGPKIASKRIFSAAKTFQPKMSVTAKAIVGPISLKQKSCCLILNKFLKG